MPSSAFDTFFACTIIVAAVLIATTFLGTTLQARIESTGDVNKDSYLKAIADHIITSSGAPTNWGQQAAVPSDLGLAAYPSEGTYALDMDKISRLTSQNAKALSYFDIVNSSRLTNVALGITVSQVLDISIEQSSTYTIGGDTYASLKVSTSIYSKSSSASLHCYIVADNFFDNMTQSIPESGSCTLTAHVPTELVDDALVVVFARAPFDERITSYAIYSFADTAQQTTPTSTALSLSPQDYTLAFNDSSGITVQNVYALTYSYTLNQTSIGQSSCTIQNFGDSSPYVLVACGVDGANYMEEWTSYPQVPLSAGSSFPNSERNIFSYLVTIDGVLYRVEISLGDVNS